MTRLQLCTTLVTGFFVVALLLRPLLHRLKTGAWGLHGLSGTPRQAGWWGGFCFILSLALTPAALWWPALVELPLAPGLLLASAGALLTFVAQAGMGASWRIGVRASDRTALVTTGLFALVRNPIFTGMLSFAAGLAVLWPNALSFAAAVSLLVAVELQVRFVEEPYLRALHGQPYVAWARRVGRFVPGLGRVR
ncbi:MAG: isoprenylcysteine carboxylmethyltransferase family protein [Archangiaceae bacterium]|nr:isoprenylcysteine carboxylmethyltransferase family protein [Archangiaceae bacterium]